MIRTAYFMTLSIALAATANAQDIDPPPNLAGFLKSGMHVGVRATDDANGIKIVVYADSDFAIAKDAQILDLDQLAAKYESVAKGLEEELQRLASSLKERGLEVYRGDKIGKSNVKVFVDRRYLLYKIAHVGSDYILVADPDDPNKRRAYATRFISTISWHDELRFSTAGLRYVKAKATEQSTEPTSAAEPN